MRNPNGYGCIKHLSGRRRRPFVFVVTDEGRQRPVEYFTNLVDAQIFQADYHRAHHHRSLPGDNLIYVARECDWERNVIICFPGRHSQFYPLFTPRQLKWQKTGV